MTFEHYFRTQVELLMGKDWMDERRGLDSKSILEELLKLIPISENVFRVANVD